MSMHLEDLMVSDKPRHKKPHDLMDGIYMNVQSRQAHRDWAQPLHMEGTAQGCTGLSQQRDEVATLLSPGR
jgi:hypothetical protein